MAGDLQEQAATPGFRGFRVWGFRVEGVLGVVGVQGLGSRVLGCSRGLGFGLRI